MLSVNLIFHCRVQKNDINGKVPPSKSTIGFLLYWKIRRY